MNISSGATPSRYNRVQNLIHSFYGIACAVLAIVALGVCIPPLIHYAAVLTPSLFPSSTNECVDRYFDDEPVGLIVFVSFTLVIFLVHVGYMAQLYVRLPLFKYIAGCATLTLVELFGIIFIFVFQANYDDKCQVVQQLGSTVSDIDGSGQRCARAILDDGICRNMSIFFASFVCIIVIHFVLQFGVVYTYTKLWLDREHQQTMYRHISLSIHEDVDMNDHGRV